MINKKRICYLVDFTIPAESEKINKYLNLDRTEKIMEYEVDNDTNYNESFWNSHQNPGKETEGTGNQRKNQDHPDHSAVKIS